MLAMSNRTPRGRNAVQTASASGKKSDRSRLGSNSSISGSGIKTSANKPTSHTCGACDKVVSEEGIECEICVTWFHYSCTKFSRELAKSLAIPGVHWYCVGCDHPNFKTIESRIEKLVAGSQQHDQSLIDVDGLKAFEQKVGTSLIEIKEQITETLETKLATTLTEFRVQLNATNNLIEHLKNSCTNDNIDLTQTEQQPMGTGSAHIKTFSSVVKSPNQPDATLVSHPKTAKLRPNRVDFDPSKCVVVHSFGNKALALNHVAIRHSISNLLDNPIIMFLNRFEHDKNDPKLMIQFEKSSSVDQLLEKWNPTTENCKLRRPQRPSPRMEGICFGVPENISENELLDYVKLTYPSCDKVVRFMSRNKTASGTVKFIFKEMNDLHNAIEDGIYIQQLCLKLNVERARPPKPRPLQCYNCWGYGHLASKCSSNKICRRCSEEIPPENDHKNCTNPLKCCNCGSLDHDATSHSDCPLFERVLQKLSNRETIRNTQP